MKTKVGDWVSFVRNGTVVVGVVMYVVTKTFVYVDDIVTSLGVVQEPSILEIRSKQ